MDRTEKFNIYFADTSKSKSSMKETDGRKLYEILPELQLKNNPVVNTRSSINNQQYQMPSDMVANQLHSSDNFSFNENSSQNIYGQNMTRDYQTESK
jgi:hypothetical protein